MRFEEFTHKNGFIKMSVNPMMVMFVGEHTGADGTHCFIKLADGSQHALPHTRAEVEARLHRAMHEPPPEVDPQPEPEAASDPKVDDAGGAQTQQAADTTKPPKATAKAAKTN